MAHKESKLSNLDNANRIGNEIEHDKCSMGYLAKICLAHVARNMYDDVVILLTQFSFYGVQRKQHTVTEHTLASCPPAACWTV